MGAKHANPKATPVFKPLLNKNSDRKERNEDSFHCGSTIRSPSCLEGCARPGTSMEVHQATKFSNYPKASHDAAIKRIGK